MNSFVKDFLFPDSPEYQYNEEACLLAEIAEAKNKLQYAWNHFEYAAPEYVEIAVLELLLAENRYCLLNRRYRLLLGLSQTPVSADWQLQRQTFCGQPSQ